MCFYLILLSFLFFLLKTNYWLIVSHQSYTVYIDFLVHKQVKYLLTFAESTTPGHLGQLVQHRVHLLPRLGEHCYQIVGLLRVVGREERVRSACVGRASCAPDTVHVVLRRLRVVVVYHKLDVVHICPQTMVGLSFNVLFEVC